MNKQIKVLIALVLLVVSIAAAFVAYNSLVAQGEAPENLIQFGTRNEIETEAEIANEPETEVEIETVAENETDIETAIEAEGESEIETEIESETDTESETDRQPAPDITVLDINGNEVQLSSLFGKPIVLNFWATWCPACVQESPYFEKLYREMGDEVHFMKVNLLDGRREVRDNVDRFIENHDYTFPVYFDETGLASAPYGIRSIPMTFFIDTDGNLAAAAQGAVDEQMLRQGINMAR